MLCEDYENTIPVLVMTRNEGEYLRVCVMSILETVKLPIKIYIIDNNSDCEYHFQTIQYLSDNVKNIEIVFNDRNNWILGLNKTIDKIKIKHKSKYFFLTDADINFSNCCTDEECWLTYLFKLMESNVVIGKIGLSLNWDYIINESDLSDIYKQEVALYNESWKVGDLYISPVDTTASLLRFDWSIEKNSRFYPNHMRYLRPELYSCRTPRHINVEHLGWYKYNKETLSNTNVDSKVICFTILGAALKKEIVNQASISVRLFFLLLSKPFHYFWIARRMLALARYILIKAKTGFDGQQVK